MAKFGISETVISEAETKINIYIHMYICMVDRKRRMLFSSDGFQFPTLFRGCPYYIDHLPNQKAGLVAFERIQITVHVTFDGSL